MKRGTSRRLLLGLSVAALATAQLAAEAQAQTATNIAPDTEIGFDTNTVVTAVGDTSEITGGEVEGGNLFHSFAEFDLAQNSFAVWARSAPDAGSILNIVNRVRSGSPSNIDGTLTVRDMPNADFWFINPAGVVFGTEAAVNVPNAAHFSTAQELQFGAGPSFSTVTPDGSTFSSAAPTAFGFLGGQGAIELANGLRVLAQIDNKSNTIQLLASDVSIRGEIFAPDASVGITAVGVAAATVSADGSDPVTGNGSIALGDDGAETFFFVDAFSATGEAVTLTGAEVSVFGAGGLTVAANDVLITGESNVSSDASGIAGGPIRLTANTVQIDSASAIFSSTDGSAASGDIVIVSDAFSLLGSSISTRTDSSGSSGAIAITADTISLAEAASPAGDIRTALIETLASGVSTGQAGSITLTGADRVSLRDGANISQLVAGTANGSTINLTAPEVEIISQMGGGLVSFTEQQGSAASISVVADTVLFEGGGITTDARLGSSGNSGTISVTAADSLRVVGGQISSLARSLGDNGDMHIAAGELIVSDNAFITTGNGGSGTAGDLTIAVDSVITLSDTSTISSGISSQDIFPSSGQGGAINITAAEIVFQDGGQIRSLYRAFTAEPGAAGGIFISVEDLTMSSGSIDTTTSTNGDAGSIAIEASGTVSLFNSSISSDTLGSDAEFLEGSAGPISISADTIELIAESFVTSSTQEIKSGDAGSILLEARNNLVIDGASVSTSSSTEGNAGQITINAQTFDLITGGIGSDSVLAGNAGTIAIDVVGEAFFGAGIGTSTGGSGNAGSVSITAGSAVVAGTIASSTQGRGDAGAVTFAADSAVFTPGGRIETEAGFGSTGNAGSVLVDIVGELVMQENTSFSAATSGSGNAGDVSVRALDAELFADARISSQSLGNATGNAGSVTLDIGGFLETAPGAIVSTSTEGSGDAGSVTVNADILFMPGGEISSSTSGAGDAGTVSINARRFVIDSGAVSATTSGDGDAGAVLIDVADDFQMRGDGVITSATTGTGDAGNVDIQANNVRVRGISSISSEGSLGNGGTVSVTSRVDMGLFDAARIFASTTGIGSAGSVDITAPVLVMFDGFIGSTTQSDGNAGTVNVVSDRFRIEAGSISTSTSGAGSAGEVTIDTRLTDIIGGGNITSEALLGSSGDAGDVSVVAREAANFTDAGRVSSAAFGSGNAGAVSITTPVFTITDTVRITSSTFGSGNAGAVDIIAADIYLTGNAGVTSVAEGGSTGGAGAVTLNATGTVVVDNDSFISSSTFGEGDGGTVRVLADVLEMRSASELNSLSDFGATGQAGSVIVDVGTFIMADAATLSSATRESGDAGVVAVTADLVQMNGGRILSDTEGTGDAGDVNLTADVVAMSNGAILASSTTDDGNAGRVNVMANQLSIDGSFVETGTTGAGDAGQISLVAETIEISNVSSLASSTTAGGNAGSIALRAASSLSIRDSGISSSSGQMATGNAGGISLDGGNADLFNVSLQTGVSNSVGSAGSIVLNADDAVIVQSRFLSSLSDFDATGIAGQIEINTTNLDFGAGSFISAVTAGVSDASSVAITAQETLIMSGLTARASTFGRGNAGSVSLVAPYIELNGQIVSSSSVSEASGNAGLVTVTADTLVNNGGQIVSTSVGNATGNAGSVIIDVDDFTMTSGRVTSFSTTAGDAGTVRIDAGDFDLSGGFIASSTNLSGAGGDVTIVADTARLSGTGDINSSAFRLDTTGNAGTVSVVVSQSLEVTDNASINARTAGIGNAGAVNVVANDIHLSGEGSIGSEAQAGAIGNAGGVSVTANAELSLADDASIVASTQGPGDAGTVDVNAGRVVVLGGRISSSTQGAGDAGIVDITAREQLIMDGEGRIVSSTRGAGAAGDVMIRAAQASLDGRALIGSQSLGDTAGDAGQITLAITDRLSLAFQAEISALTQGTGQAGAVRIDTPMLFMDGGSINSFTFGSGDAGLVEIDARIIETAAGEITSLTSGGGDAGNVLITGETVILSGPTTINSIAGEGSTGSAGNVDVITTDAVILTAGATIEARTLGAGPAGSVVIDTDSLFVSGGTISSSTFTGGDAGDVSVNARNITLVQGAVPQLGEGEFRAGEIISRAEEGSTGAAGDVVVRVSETLIIDDGGGISAASLGTGDAGFVRVETNRLEMNGGGINSFTAGSGDAGFVDVTADSIAMIGGRIDSASDSAEDGAGDAGDVLIEARTVSLDGVAIIDSRAMSGEAGNVLFDVADDLNLTGEAEISAATAGSGNAGNVAIIADRLAVAQMANINSETTSTGDAGLVMIEVDALQMSGGEINTASRSIDAGAGDAGFVDVRVTGQLDISGGSISSFTSGPGEAGLVTVFANAITMTGGRIDSSSDGTAEGSGNAGGVVVDAQSLSLSGNASIDSQSSGGDAGDVAVTVRGELQLAEMSGISAATSGAGRAGSVDIRADQLVMSGGNINSFTRGSGDAGLVTVTVNELTMAGGRITSASQDRVSETATASIGPVAVDPIVAGDAGDVLLDASTASLSGMALVDSVGETGNAGNVTVTIAGALALADGAAIAASTSGSGDAGVVAVASDALTISGGEIASSTTGSGNAGLVNVQARELTMTGGRITSSTDASGNAGDVFVTAQRGGLSGMASINSRGLGGASGEAGRVTVTITEQLLLDDRAEISTAAQGTGDAGGIRITAPRLLLDNGSRVTSTAAGTASAGAITILGDFIRIDNGSQVTTNSMNGPAGDITLTLPDDGFLGLSGTNRGVITTSSGANSGGRITISNPFLILAEGSSILALGEQGGANVEISSAFFIRSSDTINLLSVDGSLVLDSQIGDQITGTEPVDLGFLDASGILSGQCATSSSGRTSRFTSQITGPYTLAPITMDDTVQINRDTLAALAAQPRLAACS